MSKAIAEIAVGVGLIALDIFAPEIGIELSAAWASAIAGAGASFVMGGIGTLLTKQMQGLSANARNPIQPWNVIYGQARVGGDIVFLLETGTSDKYLHMIYVLACHPCQSVDAILFDDKRIPLDTSGNSISFGDSTSVIGSQQTVSINTISRQGDVVTVVMANPMPLYASTAAGPALQTGDTVQIQNVSDDQTLNGQYQIQLENPTTFSYICGGNPVSLSGQGQVKTTWPDYGDTVSSAIALGNQTTNPFPTLAAQSNGLWTSRHVLQGRTAVYLRLKYGGNTYASGLPNISFLVSGKADIYDPRTGGTAYTTNSALVIADYLTQPTWGYKAAYGSEVPIGPLAAAANICDESVALANGGSELRYTCNGSFQLSAKRGEILQNLLTSCGGRLTYSGGQFVINPAAWTGTTVQAGQAVVNANGSGATTATLYLLSSHTDGSPSSGGVIAQDPHIHPIGLFQTRYFMSDSFSAGGAWTKRVDSVGIDPSNLNGLTLGLAICPALGGDVTTPEVFQIYDCYAVVNFADGTTGTYRPTQANINNTWTEGTITNPGNAIDGDPNSAATITRSHFDAANFSSVLILTGFPFVSTTDFTPTIVATDALSAAAGAFQWKPKVPIRDLYNGVKATYICPANNWQSSDMPPYAQDQLHGYSSDANLAADGERRWCDIQLPFTNSTATAQRLAKIELLRRRQQGTGTFVYNLAMYQATALDILSMTLPYLGWTNKLLEVSAHRLIVSKQDRENGSSAMLLGTEIDVQETDPSIYDWATSEELSAQGYAQGGSGIQTVAAPTGTIAASGTAVAAVAANGTSQSRVQITWTAPTDGYVVNGGSTIVQYQIAGSNTWTALGNFDPSTTTAYINGVSDGTSYTARIAYLSAQGIQSDWTVLPPVLASGSTGIKFADDETPAGTVNGTNGIFTLAHTPNPAVSLELYLNGVLQIPGTNYTLSAATITFTTHVPAATSTLRAWYRY